MSVSVDKPKVPGAEVTAKADKPKTEKVAKEKTEKPKAPSGPRKPRVDYGYRPGAQIHLTSEFSERTYRGKRLAYAEILKECEGKTVEEFIAMCPENDPPRGWLRFFIQDGTATLSGGVIPEPKPRAKKAKAGPEDEDENGDEDEEVKKVAQADQSATDKQVAY